MTPTIAVLTGAGISAESGLQTFRDADGLWENHRVEEVATPEAWAANRPLVLQFYNERRRQLLQYQPNPAHRALVRLENRFEVTIITQNVDDLHERAGSSRVIHLHGELLKARSTGNPHLIYDWPRDIELNDTCELGFPLRPHIVWFGEAVPMIEIAARVVASADILVIIGTSLLVYPAAGLIHYARPEIPKWLINPDSSHAPALPHLQIIQEKASTGVEVLVNLLLKE